MFLLGINLLVNAQDNSLFGDQSVVFKRQIEGGFHARTNGWGADFGWGKYKGAYKVNMYHVEIGNLRDDREIRSFNSFYDDARSYIYGKINSVFTLKATYGRKKIWHRKMRIGGVQVSRRWALGPTLAFKKPIYLLIGKPDFPFRYVEEERYDPSIHFVSNIYGRASYFSGIAETKLVPGLHAKYLLNFEYSGERDIISALELGLSFDAYLVDLEIMANQQREQMFLSLFVALKFGRRFAD